jgi:hypothetical protein
VYTDVLSVITCPRVPSRKPFGAQLLFVVLSRDVAWCAKLDRVRFGADTCRPLVSSCARLENASYTLRNNAPLAEKFRGVRFVFA